MSILELFDPFQNYYHHTWQSSKGQTRDSSHQDGPELELGDN
jgi:hypothetical protein